MERLLMRLASCLTEFRERNSFYMNPKILLKTVKWLGLRQPHRNNKTLQF